MLTIGDEGFWSLCVQSLGFAVELLQGSGVGQTSSRVQDAEIHIPWMQVGAV